MAGDCGFEVANPRPEESATTADIATVPPDNPIDKKKFGTYMLLVAWAGVAVLAGAILTSFHQPMRQPEAKILTLTRGEAKNRWRLVHFLSGSCGCSQRVMRHLLARGRFAGVAEEVVLVDGGEEYLPGSRELADELDRTGFVVTHIRTDAIPRDAGLHGVPVLVVARPDGPIVYMGGYGSGSDQDTRIFDEARAGGTVRRLAIVGCAVGARARAAADPFRMKYGRRD
jgi:hypothetical protein